MTKHEHDMRFIAESLGAYLCGSLKALKSLDYLIFYGVENSFPARMKGMFVDKNYRQVRFEILVTLSDRAPESEFEFNQDGSTIKVIMAQIDGGMRTCIYTDGQWN
jgi:hypothetical protein